MVIRCVGQKGYKPTGNKTLTAGKYTAVIEYEDDGHYEGTVFHDDNEFGCEFGYTLRTAVHRGLYSWARVQMIRHVMGADEDDA